MKLHHYINTAISILLLGACANPGSGPDGGPYDETPPRIVQMMPAAGQTGVTERRAVLHFNEYVQIENAAEKVIVSPPQIEVPTIRAAGKRITVQLSDTLRPNTTYTVDFSDAITDVNEGNPLGNFTYFFSTGEKVDTMEVEGNVLQADDLEPVKGILVGLHSNLSDTAFTRLPFERVARTDSRGHFSIKGVAPGEYRVYALQDMDGDFRHSAGERLAVLRKTVKPASYPDQRNDTLWRDTVQYDTIISHPFTHYTPDDLVLLAYNERPMHRYFLKAQRDAPESFTLYFTAPSAHVPQIEALNFELSDLLPPQRSAGNDTITYWLRKLDLPAIDSLQIAMTYACYDDSLQRDTLRCDTLELLPKQTMAWRKKQEARAKEKWEKELEKRHKKGNFSNETPPVETLRVGIEARSLMPPDRNPVIRFPFPAAHIDSAGIRLLLEVDDSTKVPAPRRLLPAEDSLRALTVMAEWRAGQRYTLAIDSAAIQGLYGTVNANLEQRFRIGTPEDYGALFLLLPDADSTAVVQLLQSEKKIERQVKSVKGRADFFYLLPGKYYLRLFHDRNGNGLWDTGDYALGRDPEEVYYFSQPIEVRANWDIEQAWRIHELPLTQQKPKDLRKQKEEKKETPRNRNAERLRNKGN